MDRWWMNNIPSSPALWTATWRFLGRNVQPAMKLANLACSPLKRPRGPVVLAKEQAKVRPTPEIDIDKAVEKLDEKRDAWQRVSCEERAKMLSECLESIRDVAVDASTHATEAHGCYGSGIGEEYLFWVPAVMGLIEYRDAMLAGGQPAPSRMHRRHGRHIVDVFPKGMLSAVFGDMRFEVWIQEGKEPTQGAIYRAKASPDFIPNGHVSLVLGAGNYVSVVILDILHKLIHDNSVTIVKMNDQNAFLGVYVERALRPFFEGGFVKLVYGGVQEASYLCLHTLVHDIHLTGSIQTFNNIVFHTDYPEKGSEPVTEKEVKGELGCVTPAIVVPGKWTIDEMEYVAMCIVAGLTGNSSHSCCAFECIVTSASWPQRSEFLKVLEKKLNEKECQTAWYRGSKERYERFSQQFPDALRCGHRTYEDKNIFPWLFATGLSPDRANTNDENWCGVLQEIVLPSSALNVDQFLHEAVAFCNEHCWGSLSCAVFMDPQTQRRHAEAFDAAIADLRYGTIVVNALPALGFLPAGTWGAYAGNALWDIGSGNCMVHNTSLYDYPEKTVCYAPWRLYPVAFWTDITNKDALIDAFVQFSVRPGILPLLRTVSAALQAG